MAYIVGYVSKAERAELVRRGWDVEDASYYQLVGSHKHALLEGPKNGDEAIVIFVDADLLKVMDGPDWDKGPDPDDERCKHGAYRKMCPDCTPMPEDAEER